MTFSPHSVLNGQTSWRCSPSLPFLGNPHLPVCDSIWRFQGSCKYLRRNEVTILQRQAFLLAIQAFKFVSWWWKNITSCYGPTSLWGDLPVPTIAISVLFQPFLNPICIAFCRICDCNSNCEGGCYSCIIALISSTYKFRCLTVKIAVFIYFLFIMWCDLWLVILKFLCKKFRSK